MLVAIILLSSCHKESSVKPVIESNNINKIGNYKLADTIPDGASFKIKLWTDTTNYDETAFIFRHSASLKYVFNEDACYMRGFGKVSLASISSDARMLAIDALPYHDGLMIPLDVEAKTATAATLGLCSRVKIPANLHVWLKDKLARDSTDLSAANYNFNIASDSNSFGNKRFLVVLRFDSGCLKH